MSWEVEIETESPKAAAEQARALQMERNMPATVFDVWEHASRRWHTIDLLAADDQLEAPELAAIRTAMRKLQCSRHLPHELKSVMTAMLIFLDDGERRRREKPHRRL